jgi:GNAT superfamily N-acetyltransferase
MIEIRPACEDDLAALERFNQAMARETEDAHLDPEVLRAGVSAALADQGRGRYFVAERDGRVAAALLVTYEWSDWRNARFWWIQSVYVEPEHRGAGLFKALYRHVEELASRDGACGLRLYVHEHNVRAQAVYARLGMVRSSYRVMETPDRLRRGEGS